MAEIARFAAAILLDHDRDVEADERADIGREEAVGADDLDHRPASGERDRHLRDARVAGAGGGVDPLTAVDLFRAGNQVERVRLILAMAVGARGRRRGAGTSEPAEPPTAAAGAPTATRNSVAAGHICSVCVCRGVARLTQKKTN